MKRRRAAPPRWVDEATYGGCCLKCASPVRPGDRFLYFPGRGPMCAGCGERRKREEAESRRLTLAAVVRGGVSAAEVYEGSDGALTRAFAAELERRGPRGRVAALLFRAQKSSRRAKKYGPTAYRGLAYGRKGEALRELAAALAEHGAALGISFGWGRDEGGRNPWVLYVDLPLGQVSFHSPERYDGPDYAGGWDGLRASEGRIIRFCDSVIAGPAVAR